MDDVNWSSFTLDKSTGAEILNISIPTSSLTNATTYTNTLNNLLNNSDLTSVILSSAVNSSVHASAKELRFLMANATQSMFTFNPSSPANWTSVKAAFSSECNTILVLLNQYLNTSNPSSVVSVLTVERSRLVTQLTALQQFINGTTIVSSKSFLFEKKIPFLDDFLI
jgi:hypothetical protein